MNLSDVYDDSKLGVLSQNLTTNLFKGSQDTEVKSRLEMEQAII
jgi:hypothetical protein